MPRGLPARFTWAGICARTYRARPLHSRRAFLLVWQRVVSSLAAGSLPCLRCPPDERDTPSAVAAALAALAVRNGAAPGGGALLEIGLSPGAVAGSELELWWMPSARRWNEELSTAAIELSVDPRAAGGRTCRWIGRRWHGRAGARTTGACARSCATS